MHSLTAWIEANPSTAALLAPVLGALSFVVWSEFWHGAGRFLDARGWPGLGAICHRLATRTPPTNVTEAKVRAVELRDDILASIQRGDVKLPRD